MSRGYGFLFTLEKVPFSECEKPRVSKLLLNARVTTETEDGLAIIARNLACNTVQFWLLEGWCEDNQGRLLSFKDTVGDAIDFNRNRTP